MSATRPVAFGDPLSLTIPDPDHFDDEDRFLLIGRSARQRKSKSRRRTA